MYSILSCHMLSKGDMYNHKLLKVSSEIFTPKSNADFTLFMYFLAQLNTLQRMPLGRNPPGQFTRF